MVSLRSTVRRHWPILSAVVIPALYGAIRWFYPYHFIGFHDLLSIQNSAFPGRIVVFPLLSMVYSMVPNLIAVVLFGFLLTWWFWKIIRSRVAHILLTALMVVCCGIWVLFSLRTSFSHEDTIYLENTPYHLASFMNTESDSGISYHHIAFVIFSCDPTGLLCREIGKSNPERFIFGGSTSMPVFSLTYAETTGELLVEGHGEVQYSVNIGSKL